MNTDNPNAFAFNSNRAHHKSNIQRPKYPVRDNRWHLLSLNWTQERFATPREELDAMEALKHAAALATLHTQSSTTLTSILHKNAISLRVDPSIAHAFVILRRAHVEPALIEAVRAKLGELDEATAQHLATHQSHQALLELLHIAEEELAGYIVGDLPYRHRLVDREHPEQTRLFVYIDVSGNMDAIIEAQERISARKSPRDRFEPLHVSVVFQG
jgi:hypothetical protein